jgi:hypothetical protein
VSECCNWRTLFLKIKVRNRKITLKDNCKASQFRAISLSTWKYDLRVQFKKILQFWKPLIQRCPTHFIFATCGKRLCFKLDRSPQISLAALVCLDKNIFSWYCHEHVWVLFHSKTHALCVSKLNWIPLLGLACPCLVIHKCTLTTHSHILCITTISKYTIYTLFKPYTHSLYSPYCQVHGFHI